MSNYNKFSERTIARLLSQYVDRGVPDSTDLWPTLTRRLQERERNSKDFINSGSDGVALTHSRPAASRQRPKMATFLRLAAGLLGVLLLAGVTTLSISRLARHQNNDAAWTTSANADGRLYLAREGDGFRLGTAEGRLSSGTLFDGWLDPSHLLVRWHHPTDQSQIATYLADLNSGKTLLLDTKSDIALALPSPDSKRAVLLHWSEYSKADNSPRALMLDMDSGEVQTIFDLDPTAPQWSAEVTAHNWNFGDVYVYLKGEWAGQDYFVLTLRPRLEVDYAPYGDWGKVLLVDVAGKHVRVLAEEGQVAAILPNRGVLLRLGWVDGDLQFLPLPPTGAPVKIATRGHWTQGWAVSPDGLKVAWLEAVAPPGDWSRRKPICCLSPQPTVQSLVVWDSSLGREVLRSPVDHTSWFLPGMSQLEGSNMRWRKDGSAVLYVGHPNNGTHTALFETDMGGRSSVLAAYDWDGYLRLHVLGNDESLYYEVGDVQHYRHPQQMVRRYPKGRLEPLHEGGAEMGEFVSISNYVDMRGRWVTRQDGDFTLQDLATGKIIRVNISHRVKNPIIGSIPWVYYREPDLSPDDALYVYHDPDAESRVLRIIKTR